MQRRSHMWISSRQHGHLLWARAHLKWLEATCRNVQLWKELKLEILFEKNMNPEPKSIGTIPSIGTNPWSYRWISAYRIGKLHMESRHQCWKIYAGFRSIQSSIQTSLSGKVLHILKRQIASITIENLHSRRVWVLKRWLLSSWNPTSDKNQETFLSRKFWKVF